MNFFGMSLLSKKKVDGANLGISCDSEGNIRGQNRGAYLHLPGSGQWKKLGEWLWRSAPICFSILFQTGTSSLENGVMRSIPFSITGYPTGFLPLIFMTESLYAFCHRRAVTG